MFIKGKPAYLYPLVGTDENGVLREAEDKEERLKAYQEKANEYITNMTTTGCIYTDDDKVYDCENCILGDYYCNYLNRLNYVLLWQMAFADNCLLTSSPYQDYDFEKQKFIDV